MTDKPGATTRASTLLQHLTTPQLADACQRAGVEVRCAPHDLRALSPSNCRLAGPVRPVRHYGSSDVILEALEFASPGQVLVIDNGGRRDEAVIGGLTALQTKADGLAGIVVWGLHRDTPDILESGLPVFSLGAIPTAPRRLDAREREALLSARVGPWLIGPEDLAIGDEDGVLFVPQSREEEVAKTADSIRAEEDESARKVREGIPLLTQWGSPERPPDRTAD